MKRILPSAYLLFLAAGIYFLLTSSSNGVTGASSSGCGGGSCHASSMNTVLTITGIPVTGYVAGTTYTLTLTVSNSTMTAAGFNLKVSDGVLSAVPAGTALSSGNSELNHTTPKTMSSGSATWMFNWTATSTPAVTIDVAGNAVNLSNSSAGDAWAISTTNYNQAITTPTAPSVLSSSHSMLTVNSAVINASVNANGASTSVSVDYGTTTAYGSNVVTTPGVVIGSSPSAVTASIGGLLPGTQYHYKVKAANSIGTTYGNDGVFTTQPASVQDIPNGLFNIYPNPIYDRLFIHTTLSDLQFTLIALDGRIISIYPSAVSQDEYLFDLSILRSGYYFIKIRYDAIDYSYPVIKR
jgi:hypothetical protein